LCEKILFLYQVAKKTKLLLGTVTKYTQEKEISMCAQCDQNKRKVINEIDLASNLSCLLHKVLNFHEVDGLSQMVLHELGHEDQFNFNKATYLVDNPDFNHLLGVAGYSNDECHYHQDDLWQDPYSFIKDMESAKYHNEVKNYLNDSLRRKDINLNNSKEVKELGAFLGLKKPEYFSWNSKNGNHGILLFEPQEQEQSTWRVSFLHNIAALLSFCGI